MAQQTTISQQASPRQTSAPLTAVLVVFMLLVFTLRCYASITAKSFVIDEPTFITSGYYMLQTGDYTLHAAHPISLQMLLAAPLLGMPLELPTHTTPFFQPGAYTDLDGWRYGVAFMSHNANQVNQIILYTRFVSVFLSLVLALFIYTWSSKQYGRFAGLATLFLYTFSPNILAHSSLATLDIGFALVTSLTIYYYSKLIQHPTGKHLLLAGVFLGLALAAKNTAPMLIGVCGLYIILARPAYSWSFIDKRFSTRTWRAILSFFVSYAGTLLIAGLVINLAYGFHGSFLPLTHYISSLTSRLSALNNPTIQGLLQHVPVPFPESFMDMVFANLSFTANGYPTFLMGNTSSKGWWYYHLVTFLLKVPLPTILLTFLAVGLFTLRQRKTAVSPHEASLALAVCSIFLFVSIVGVKIGFRHLLPIMPLLFVLLGWVLTQLWTNKTGQLVIGVLSIWYLVSSLLIHPHYLAYFNELIGGPANGYKYLVDSNLDWGQDLKGLAEYMDANQITQVQLSYFGSADPAFYGIGYTYLPSIGLRPSAPDGKWWYEAGYQEVCQPTSGTIAVSATNLQGVLLQNHDCFAWLKQYEPVANIGYSIFIYQIAP